MALLYDMCSVEMRVGREETAVSFVVKHSLAICQLLSTKVVAVPILMVNMGPWLSAMAPKVLCGVCEFLKRGRWPSIGHAPAADGGCLG